MPVTEQDVQSALKEIVDPNTGKDLVATRSARSVKVSGSDVTVDVELAYPAKTQLEPMKKLVSQKLRSLPGHRRSERQRDLAHRLARRAARGEARPRESRTSSRWRRRRAAWASRPPR